MLNYSIRTAKARAQLNQTYNDIDIYVEDNANRNMWLFVIKALIHPGTRLISVVTLGGREAVVAACKLDQTPTGRRKLYVIDGDLDFLLGRQVSYLRYFYRLRANNIENLLLSEEAFVEIGLEYQPGQTAEMLKGLIDYAGHCLHFEKAFRPLFVAYGVTQSLRPSIPTTSFPVTNLIKHKSSGPTVDVVKLRRRIISLYLNLSRQMGVETVRRARNEVALRAANLPIGQVVSGKDYLLPLLLLRFKAVCGYGGSKESFKVALARSFSPSSEPRFARRINRLIR